MGKAIYISKKQKLQMKARRKKKRAAEATETSAASPGNNVEENENRPLAEQTTADAVDTYDDSKKRPRDDESQPEANKKRALDIETKTIKGKLHVIVPSKIAEKDMKKFRKEARRQLRSEGKDDSEVQFVSQEDLPSQKKKNFPSIKELLKHKHQLEELMMEEEKKQKKMQEIPDEVKAQYVALDCEMVGIGTDGKKSVLARVSIVDWDFNVVLDTFVKVPIRVTDFRTHVSGVEPKHLKNSNAMDVDKCRNLVASLLKDKVLVGHALTNDFKALMLAHPKAKIRDTAKYRPFQRFANGKWRARKLRDLVKENLKEKEGFQEAEHDSVQDARATMELFQLVRSQWEKEMAAKAK